MNTRIQFGEPVHPEVPEEVLPPDFLLTGSPKKWEAAPFRIYILQEVYDEIWAHVNKTPAIESGGVLVGHPFRTFDGQTTFVVITAAVPQHSQDRSGGHFTVGPVQIAEARREMEQRYSGLIAVGWYHSHPGHGVFLSGQDMTIVRSIYDAPWHVALVVDPQRVKEGIFVGPEGMQIGHRGDQPRGMSWVGLRDVPDSVKAIALYNQMRDRLQEKQPEAARDAMDRLYSLVESSSQLRHWRDRREYRDLTKHRSEMGDSPPQQFLILEAVAPQQSELYETPNKPPFHTPPEPVRRRKGWSPIHWLMLATVFTVGFAAFSLITVLLANTWPYWITLGWGILLSLLAVVLAGYVVFSREEVERAQPGQLEVATRSMHFAGERITALFLVGLVLILWVSYGVFSARLVTSTDSPISPEPPTLIASQTPIPTAIPPSATATATATHTPTLTPTSTPTDTPTPSPTATHTSTPTYTPTWTPTATLTITPTLSETTVLTSTNEITSTHPITTS